MDNNRVIYERPYDAEVEYLDKGYFIDTGVISQEGIVVTLTFKLENINNTYALFGVRENRIENDSADYRSLLYFSCQKVNDVCVWESYMRTKVTTSIPCDTDIHTVIFDTVTNKVYLDGVQIASHSGTVVTSDHTLSIRGLHYYNNTIHQRADYIIYDCKISLNGTLVRDFIPVRKGSTGFMYDKVSGNLFANKGTGNFILGQDIPNPVPNIRRVFRFNNKRFVMPMPYDSKIEYLEFSGNQYIDTLFKGNTTTTKFKMIFMLHPSIGNIAIFGSRNTIGGIDSSAMNIFRIGNNLRMDWAIPIIRNSNINIAINNNIQYNIEITRGYVKLNNVERTYSTFDSVNNRYNFLIGNFTNGSNSPFQTGFKGKIYSAQLYNNNVLIMDFIPVRRGNVGYLYDKVSGKLFGNAGTGQFILGNDINN